MTNKSHRKKSYRRSANSSPTNSHNNPSFSKCRMATLLISALVFVCLLGFFSISSNMGSAVGVEPNIDPVYNVKVVNEFPHDPDAFTQVCSLII